MSTLLQLTSQGDVGTLRDESKLSTIKLMDPQQLYQLWERQNWVSHAIDFSRDRDDWERIGDDMRGDIIWGLSSFFVGEERVTTQFSGLVMAYESQEEEAFLTTQQVDEARHAQHFSRFYDEVMGIGGAMDDQLVHVREELNDAFVELFDKHLVEAGERLIADPSDKGAKVDFVTTYHMVIEGTLALTGQNFITDFLEREGILPGFVEGFKKIAQDEHRHVAYGTWYLQQACRGDDALAERVQQKLVELLPTAASVLVPKGKDPFGEWDLLGYSSTEVNEFAFKALTRRLKVIGVGLPAVAA
jgi:ribonucleoside-diphosphate reductase beta chain